MVPPRKTHFFGFTSMKNGWGIYIWAAEVRSQGDIIWGGDSVWGFCFMHFVSQINLIIDPPPSDSNHAPKCHLIMFIHSVPSLLRNAVGPNQFNQIH